MITFSQNYRSGIDRGSNALPWLVLCLILFPGCAARQAREPVSRPVEFDNTDYRLVWPLPIATTARIVSSFGRRKDPITGMTGFHTGVDIDGTEGTPIYAAGAGKVIFTGSRQGYGLLLIIEHGKGLTTYYGHCSRLLIKQGNRVNRGQVVALMGATGRVTGSHLHFEARKHGQPFDPFNLLPKLDRL
ncbi:MAG TPA: M23 family metallopeptidase [archaeon]|nr:M23 family metallopeptidase [archaeon]